MDRTWAAWIAASSQATASASGRVVDYSPPAWTAAAAEAAAWTAAAKAEAKAASRAAAEAHLMPGRALTRQVLE